MDELTIEATLENLPQAEEFVDTQLERLAVPKHIQMQIDIAVDELMTNIVSYAYRPETGPATVRVEVQEDPVAVVVTFIDHGVPYDPLAQQDPDTSLSLDERDPGGLGILLVKKSMDDISYSYSNGQNILSIKKNLS